MKVNSENIFKRELPNEYIQFLKENPNGGEIAFNEFKDKNLEGEGRCWNLMGEKTLLEIRVMNGVGKATNFECLKLYIKLYKEFSDVDWAISNVGKIDLKRIESGFVIGDENGDYLYLDSSDNFSVWIYHHDGGDIMRIANSFEEFRKS